MAQNCLFQLDRRSTQHASQNNWRANRKSSQTEKISKIEGCTRKSRLIDWLIIIININRVPDVNKISS